MRVRDLPIGALRAFSVVADTGSVTGAASALGVTHGAVSKQLRNLEEWLGQDLFSRDGRLLVLSPFGSMLAKRIGPALTEMMEGCDQVHRHRGRRIVTVEAPATFAMYWLLPRLEAFRRLEPGVDVWVSTSMTGQRVGAARQDVVIVRDHHGAPAAPDPRRRLLMTEESTVLVSKAALGRGRLSEPGDIVRHALIGSSTRPDDWGRWIALAKLDVDVPGGGHRFDHLFVAMQAVRDGLGLIVAPRNIFDLHLSRGDLVCPFPELWFEGRSYHVTSDFHDTEGYRRRFLDWLTGEAGRGGEAGSPRAAGDGTRPA